MTKSQNTCPCPNLDCPNHGNCKNCTSRHLRIGKLNYCGFYSILPELEKAINSDPDSPTAQIIQNRIERQTKAYSKRKNQFDLTENMAQELRAKKSEESEY